MQLSTNGTDTAPPSSSLPREGCGHLTPYALSGSRRRWWDASHYPRVPSRLPNTSCEIHVEASSEVEIFGRLYCICVRVSVSFVNDFIGNGVQKHS